MNQSTFQSLLSIDVSRWVEKKGKFSYLSWSYAVAELMKHAPDATWEVTRWPLPDAAHIFVPYCQTPTGYFVEVAVTVGGKTLSQIHPVIDERNQTIAAPKADQINKSIMRCLVKAIALHGLGLNIYAGEDLPLDDGPPQPPPAPPSDDGSREAKAKVLEVADDIINHYDDGELVTAAPRAVANVCGHPATRNAEPVLMALIAQRQLGDEWKPSSEIMESVQRLHAAVKKRSAQ